jgi:uncharacterized damage-inducible protein DinB
MYAMNLTDLTTKLDYRYWARDRLLAAVELLTPETFTRDLGSSFKSVRDTGAHIHVAEWVWYQRWIGESPAALLPPDRSADVPVVRPRLVRSRAPGAHVRRWHG